jgi:hypothetical protein
MWRWKYLTVAGTASHRPVVEPRVAMAATDAHAEAARTSVFCVRSEMLIGRILGVAGRAVWAPVVVVPLEATMYVPDPSTD